MSIKKHQAFSVAEKKQKASIIQLSSKQVGVFLGYIVLEYLPYLKYETSRQKGQEACQAAFFAL